MEEKLAAKLPRKGAAFWQAWRRRFGEFEKESGAAIRYSNGGAYRAAATEFGQDEQD